MTIYLAYVFMKYYGYEVHHWNLLLGTFSSEEKALQAIDEYLETHCSDDGRLMIPYCSDYETAICECTLDEPLKD